MKACYGDVSSHSISQSLKAVSSRGGRHVRSAPARRGLELPIRVFHVALTGSRIEFDSESSVSQNIYDNQAFFDGYARLPRSQFGLEAAPEWPAIQAMLPVLTGKRVLDLGCGYGWFCRRARAAGAAKVLGIDLSEKMLARARELTDDIDISYQRGDLEQLVLPSQAFDVVYSQLTLHYLPDIGPLFASIHQALPPGGWFVFTVEHPIYTCSPRQAWLTDEEGQRSWAVNNYQNEGKRVSNWLADGVVKYHRTLSTTLNALIAAGFAIRHVNEWGPAAEQVDANPALAEEAERPMMVLFSAQRL